MEVLLGATVIQGLRQGGTSSKITHVVVGKVLVSCKLLD